MDLEEETKVQTHNAAYHINYNSTTAPARWVD